MTTGRGRFNVHRTGDAGPAVLMLHPLALTGSVWDPVARRLGGRVVAPDAPREFPARGCGS
jgi:pimeloyl-ACP methyl ester carboxylesterase